MTGGCTRERRVLEPYYPCSPFAAVNPFSAFPLLHLCHGEYYPHSTDENEEAQRMLGQNPGHTAIEFSVLPPGT